MRSFFRNHPKLHSTLHWLALTLGGLFELQERLLGASAMFPAGSKIPHDIAFVLAVVAFSNILVGRVDKAADPAAPVGAIPASEAITKVEQVDGGQSK